MLRPLSLLMLAPGCLKYWASLAATQEGPARPHQTQLAKGASQRAVAIVESVVLLLLCRAGCQEPRPPVLLPVLEQLPLKGARLVLALLGRLPWKRRRRSLHEGDQLRPKGQGCLHRGHQTLLLRQPVLGQRLQLLPLPAAVAAAAAAAAVLLLQLPVAVAAVVAAVVAAAAAAAAAVVAAAAAAAAAGQQLPAEQRGLQRTRFGGGYQSAPPSFLTPPAVSLGG